MGKLNAAISRGISRANNWSCKALVAVDNKTRSPLSKAGTKYAKVLPTPVPASTTKLPPSLMTSATASAISV